jgi:hypothetical protein
LISSKTPTRRFPVGLTIESADEIRQKSNALNALGAADVESVSNDYMTRIAVCALVSIALYPSPLLPLAAAANVPGLSTHFVSDEPNSVNDQRGLVPDNIMATARAHHPKGTPARRESFLLLTLFSPLRTRTSQVRVLPALPTAS